MAKVSGPLFSMSASGKVGDSIVFFGWKGRNVVRNWLKPTNKKSTKQGYVRATLKAISRWIGKVSCKSKGSAVDSTVYQGLTAMAPAGLNWNAFADQGFLAILQSAGTFSTALFNSVVGEYSSLTAAVLTAFNTNATALGMTDFAYDYGYTTNIPAGLQLYFGAKACYHNGIIGTAPYNTNPVSWAASDVNAFKTAHTA